MLRAEQGDRPAMKMQLPVDVAEKLKQALGLMQAKLGQMQTQDTAQF